MDEVLRKVYVKEKHNLPEIINFFVICSNLQKFTQQILSKANFSRYLFAVLMVLDTTLYKVLSWSSVLLTILYVYVVD